MKDGNSTQLGWLLQVNSNGEIIKDTARELLRSRDTLIMFEEDNRFSPDFLEYMAWAFVEFWDDSSVRSVCGWSPSDPNCSDPKVVTRHAAYCAWGVGLWAHKLEGVIVSRSEQYDYVISCFRDRSRLRSYFKKADHLKRALCNYIFRGGEAGDRYIDLYFFNNKFVSIFPDVSRVRNVGHDGTGVNCGVSEAHMSQDIAHVVDVDYSEVGITEEFNKRIFQHYKLSRQKNLVLLMIVEMLFICILLVYFYKFSLKKR